MVHEGLFVGPASSVYKFAGSILHCARDPWFEDVKDRAAGKNWVRIKYNELALNMVDANSPMYFPDDMINAGLEFITERFAEGDPVLVHCNMGLSRSPSIAFLWMFEHGFLDDEFRYALPQFKDLYPDYCPGNGIWSYLKRRCNDGKAPVEFEYECQGIGGNSGCGASATEQVKVFGPVVGQTEWAEQIVHVCKTHKQELNAIKRKILEK